jgi:hypothetical protein
MKPRTPFYLAIGVGVILGCVGLIKTCSSDQNEESLKGFLASRLADPEYRQTPSSQMKTRSGRRELEGEAQVRSIGEIQQVSKSFLASKEANRCRLLSTTRHGNETWYLLGVEKPAAEEIRETRKMIADLEKSADPSERERLDDWLGYLVEIYDPFGEEGSRGMLIKIPDQEDMPVSGVTFSVISFADEVRRFDPSNGDTHSFENAQFFHRNDRALPERFEKLIQVDALEDE